VRRRRERGRPVTPRGDLARLRLPAGPRVRRFPGRRPPPRLEARSRTCDPLSISTTQTAHDAEPRRPSVHPDTTALSPSNVELSRPGPGSGLERRGVRGRLQRLARRPESGGGRRSGEATVTTYSAGAKTRKAALGHIGASCSHFTVGPTIPVGASEMWPRSRPRPHRRANSIP
jgi:hypothetical protein